MERQLHLSLNRLKDWLKLLGFEVDRGNLGCYAATICDKPGKDCTAGAWSKASDRWLNFAGGVYVLRAIKRTHGMRLITPNWEEKTGCAPRRCAPLPPKRLMATEDHIEIFTDGACKGNPGPGGWGAHPALRPARKGTVGRREATPPTTAWS